jgi:hypothetical protein
MEAAKKLSVKEMAALIRSKLTLDEFQRFQEILDGDADGDLWEEVSLILKSERPELFVSEESIKKEMGLEEVADEVLGEPEADDKEEEERKE